MKKFLAAALLGAACCFSTLAVAAAPSEQQVQAALSRGDYASAQQMLGEVVKAHPDSGRAHYLYAQVLDRNGHAADALTQLNLAHQVDPAMSFTQPGRLAAVEQRIRNDAARAGNAPADTGTAALAQTPALPTPSLHSGTSPLAWLAIVVVLAGVVGILIWGVRRARSNDADRSQESLRAQLRQATELLNAVRALKLDIRISTLPGHDLLAREAEDLEAQLLRCVEALSSGLSGQTQNNGYQGDRIETLARQFDSLRARVEGRPDPYPPHAADGSQLASEAERFGVNRQPVQQTVIVQQPGGGMGMGGGLLTGVLLGEMMGGGRDRVIERDVIIDDERRQAPDSGIDFGQGSNDWSDGGGIDTGGGGGDWSDN